jgi:hypothetical protein
VTKLKNNMMIVLTAFGIAIGIIMTTGILSSIITLHGNFKSYRDTYNALASGEYPKTGGFGSQTYFKKPGALREIIRFGDGSVRLLNNDYLHTKSFVTWMSPYSLYYAYKFKKLFKKMETQEQQDQHYSAVENMARNAYEQFRNLRSEDIERDQSTGWHVTRTVESNRPKEFKFLTRNQ